MRRSMLLRALLIVLSAPIALIVGVIVLARYVEARAEGAFEVPYTAGWNLPVASGGVIAVRVLVDAPPVCGDPFATGEATYVPETGPPERIGRWRGHPWRPFTTRFGRSLVFVSEERHAFVRTASGRWKMFTITDLEHWDAGTIDRADRERIAAEAHAATTEDRRMIYVLRALNPEERLIIVDVWDYTFPAPARAFLRLSDDGERFTLDHLQRTTASRYE